MTYNLHPKVRERLQPRMSATVLAEYLTMPEAQERILHDARFAIPPMVTANGDALRAIRAYCTDPRRDESALSMVKASLTAKARGTAVTPKQRDEALRCAEIIEAFSAAENIFGIRALACEDPGHRADPLIIEGVELSIQPDLLVARGSKTGAVMFRVAKTPDHTSCTREATRMRRVEQRREMGRFLAVMMEMSLQEQGRQVDRDYVFVADTRIPERIDAATDYAARVKRIRSACRMISRLWGTIDPLPRVLRQD